MAATPSSTPGRRDRPGVGELLSTLSQQTSSLVKQEIALAKTELSAKAKHGAAGAGLLAGAALLGFFAFAALVATAILGLAHVVDAWLAALIVAVLLLVLAGVLALVGKKALERGMPPTPERAKVNVQRDVEAVKEGLRS